MTEREHTATVGPEQPTEQEQPITPEVVSGLPAIVRDGRSGRFQKGHSANPGGMKKTERAQVDLVRRAARKHGLACVEELASLMREGPPKVRLLAATALLDRGFGRPAQTIAAEGSGVAVGIVILPPEQDQ